MIYKFKSKATGDLIMMAAQAEQFLRLAEREPAAQGVIEVEVMPDLLNKLESAIAAEQDTAAATDKSSTVENEAEDSAPGLRQRLWPMVEMLRRAHAAGERVVWGV